MLEKFGGNKIMPTFASQTTKTDAQRENSSVGRARPCQGRGRGFESRFSLHAEARSDAVPVNMEKLVLVVELLVTLL